MMQSLSNMHYDSSKAVRAVRIRGLGGSVEEAQREGENDPISKLLESPNVFLVLEALEMQRQHIWRLLDLHSITRLSSQLSVYLSESDRASVPLFGLLERAASFATVLVSPT